MSASTSGAGAADTAIVDRLGDAANVLLTVPSMGTDGPDVCTELLTVTAPAETRALILDFRRTPAAIHDRWIEHVGELPAELLIMSFSDAEGWADAKALSEGSDPERVTVRTISYPGNLTEMGIALNETFERWMWEDEPVVVCFDSITAHLQFCDLDGVYRFLHLVTDRVAALDGRAHFHLDPESHEEQTVRKLHSLFDAAVTIDDDGAATVLHR